jgi:hypothetical protein
MSYAFSDWSTQTLTALPGVAGIKASVAMASSAKVMIDRIILNQ